MLRIVHILRSSALFVFAVEFLHVRPMKVSPVKEEPQYPTFDHLMQEVHAQEEMESSQRVGFKLYEKYGMPTAVPGRRAAKI